MGESEDSDEGEEKDWRYESGWNDRLFGLPSASHGFWEASERGVSGKDVGGEFTV